MSSKYFQRVRRRFVSMQAAQDAFYDAVINAFPSQTKIDWERNGRRYSGYVCHTRGFSGENVSLLARNYKTGKCVNVEIGSVVAIRE